MFRISCVIIFLLLLACSSERPAGVEGQKSSMTGDDSISRTAQPGVSPTAPGSYLLEITPINAARNSTIYLVSHGVDISNAVIEWLVNGIPVAGVTGEEFNTSETRKKDKVQARVVVRGKELISNIIEIENSPPEITNVKILPEVFKPGDTLSVEASGSDIDGDNVTVSYEWMKNGEPAGNSKQIAGPLKRGDKVEVRITPFDGEAYGRCLVLHRDILNFPPMIIENDRHNFDGNIYAYQVRASDPDGDPLTYSLKSGPPGMTIDSTSGLIKWNVPSDFTGNAAFTVAVTDSHGGVASRGLTLHIKPEQKK